MHITIIGPGRLGSSLKILLSKAGFKVTVVGRNLVEPASDLRLITVPDDDIAGVAAGLIKDRPTLHCSGSKSDDILAGHQPVGRIHPLMTFPGPEIGMPQMKPIPAAISGDEAGYEIAWNLALKMGFEPFKIPANLPAYHAAAVMAGNFAITLLAEAAQILVESGIESERARPLLAPLMLQSIHNAIGGAKTALTGPVVRGDTQVIESHRAALSELGLKKTLFIYDGLCDTTKHIIGIEVE